MRWTTHYTLQPDWLFLLLPLINPSQSTLVFTDTTTSLAAEQLNQLDPNYTSSSGAGLSSNSIVLFIQRHGSCFILAWFPKDMRLIKSSVSTHACVYAHYNYSDLWSNLTEGKCSQRYILTNVTKIVGKVKKRDLKYTLAGEKSLSAMLIFFQHQRIHRREAFFIPH